MDRIRQKGARESTKGASRDLNSEEGSKQGVSIQHEVRTVFEREDGLREVLKARLQQLGHIVDISAQAFHQELSTQPQLAEDCRCVSTEAADLDRQISRRMAELKAEADGASFRWSRATRNESSDSPGQVPTEHRSGMAFELETMRNEVRSLKLREQQLLSQLTMAKSSTTGSGLGADVAAEIGRLSGEVTALRDERDSWRSRALAAEARLALSHTAAGASDPDWHSNGAHARRDTFLAASGSGDGLKSDRERRESEVGGCTVTQGPGAILESADGRGGSGRSNECDLGEAGGLTGSTVDSETKGGSSAISINVLLSIPYAQVEEKARERSALKHTLVLDLLVALKDAGYTLRPGLVQVCCSAACLVCCSRAYVV